MKLFYFPVTNKRAILYCQRIQAPLVRKKPRIDDRVATKAAEFWAKFESSDKKWKQFVVKWTGKLLDTIPFEEHALRTVPPRHTWMRTLPDKSHISEKDAAKSNLTDDLEPIELLYPKFDGSGPVVADISRRLGKFASEAMQIHRKQMLYCILGLPLTLPLAVNPFFPNFPGMYLTYRLWANWRALKSAKHLQYLVNGNHIKEKEDHTFSEIYSTSPFPMTADLANNLDHIMHDEHFHSIVQQALRQTSAESLDKEVQDSKLSSSQEVSNVEAPERSEENDKKPWA